MKHRNSLLTIILSLCMIITAMIPAFAETVNLGDKTDEIAWVKVRNYDKYIWVGIEYSDEDVIPGSKFHVEWISDFDREYDEIYRDIDEDIQHAVTGHKYLLSVGITSPDNKEIDVLPHGATIYVQLGNEFDIANTNAWLVNPLNDELVPTVYSRVRIPSGDTVSTCVGQVNHLGNLLIAETVDAVKLGSKPVEYKIKLKNNPQVRYSKPGDMGYYSVYSEDISIKDVETGKSVSDEVKSDIAKRLYYKWSDDEGKVLLEGIGENLYMSENLQEEDFGRPIICKLYQCKGGEYYGYTTFTAEHLYIERNGFKLNGDYTEDRWEDIEFVKGQKRTVNVENFFIFDNLEVSRKDPATGQYVDCYSEVLKKHATYKWSIYDGEIVGAKNEKKVTVKLNKNSEVKCKAYLYGEYAFSIYFKAKEIKPVGFKGYKYDNSKFVADDEKVNLQLVEWKKGALPENAVFRYSKEFYTGDGYEKLVGKKTNSPYAKDSLKGVASVKGPAYYTCEVFKNKKAKKALYTVEFYAFEIDNYEWIKDGQSVTATGEVGEYLGVDAMFKPQASDYYVLSLNVSDGEVFAFRRDAIGGFARPSYDKTGEYVFKAVKGGEYSMSAYGNNTDGTLTMTLHKCTHEKTEKVDARAASKTSKGYTGDVVCCKCGKIIKDGKVIPRIK